MTKYAIDYNIDDIPQDFQKAWKYANSFMAVAIKTEEHCRAFVEAAPEWNEEEKEFLIWAWLMITTGIDTVSFDSIEEEAEVVIAINEMTKREFDDYAKEEHDIDLDRRQSKVNMIEEFKEKLKD
jgi:hypothetical protein